MDYSFSKCGHTTNLSLFTLSKPDRRRCFNTTRETAVVSAASSTEQIKAMSPCSVRLICAPLQWDAVWSTWRFTAEDLCSSAVRRQTPGGPRGAGPSSALTAISVKVEPRLPQTPHAAEGAQSQWRVKGRQRNEKLIPFQFSSIDSNQSLNKSLHP